MGLEAATYLQDLDTSNPLAGDKKNQGDDHLRLLKATLKTTFPNADRPFRFPEVINKTNAYSILTTDDGKTITFDTTVGAINVSLPTPTFDGWLVRIIKVSTDTNYVFVAPPSGFINSSLSFMRCGVPFVEYTFLWNGGAFIRVKAPGEAAPGSIEPFAGSTAPVGYNFAIGQSLTRIDNPELFQVWGTTWGAVDGTRFNAPDLRDRFLVGAQASYGLGATGGEATHILSTGEMPSHQHNGTTSGQSVSHTHSGAFNSSSTGAAGAPSSSKFGDAGTFQTGQASTDHTHDVIVGATGGGAAHENRPPYIGMNYIFRLC